MTCVCFACGAVQALPVGNPSDSSLLCDGWIWEGKCPDPNDPCLTWCDAFSFRLGFYGDYVFNRHLQLDRNCKGGRGEIEHTEIYTNAAYLAGNFWDRYDVFATLGATNLLLNTNARTFALRSTPSGCLTIETNTNFSWSVGIRGRIWECGCTTFGGEAQFFQTNPHITRVTHACEATIYPNDCVDAKYREWQLGVGISHRINCFIPYLALKWSSVKFNMDEARLDDRYPGFQLHDLSNSKEWGFALGLTLIDCEKASATVEGRFGDEKAVHVNGQLRF